MAVQKTSSPLQKIQDPYKEILGIPPGARPPHLYDLLGLELFCSEPERIIPSVRRVFRQIKPFEDYPSAETREAIQNIMTDIAAARVVLTTPEKKDEYDGKLARKLGINRDEWLQFRAAIPLPEYELVVTAGPSLVGEKLQLLNDEPIIIGNYLRCPLPLRSTRSRPNLFELHYDDGDWLLKANKEKDAPILVNDQRVTKWGLQEEDCIEAAGFRMRFRKIDGMEEAALPPLTLTLEAGPGVQEPQFHALAPESILIGHDDTALWQLQSKTVSLHHCRIESQKAGWVLVDLQSDRGTLVNGMPVTKPTHLSHRDRIELGTFVLRVQLRY